MHTVNPAFESNCDPRRNYLTLSTTHLWLLLEQPGLERFWEVKIRPLAIREVPSLSLDYHTRHLHATQPASFGLLQLDHCLIDRRQRSGSRAECRHILHVVCAIGKYNPVQAIRLDVRERGS